MKRLSLFLAAAALLGSAVITYAQTPTPHDSLTARADSMHAAIDSTAVHAATAAADTASAHVGAAGAGAAGAAGAAATAPTGAGSVSTTPTPQSTAPSTSSTPPATAPAPAPTGTSAAAPTQASASGKPQGLMGTPMYVGGSIGFSFWGDYTRISLEPFVGYKLSQRLSVGGKLRYEYLNDKRGSSDYKAHNFGASALSNYWLTKQIYAHGELAMMNYDYPTGNETVPFLMVGGGYSKMIRPGVSAYAEAVWDILNDDNSPYEAGQPVVSVGVAAGF